MAKVMLNQILKNMTYMFRITIFFMIALHGVVGIANAASLKSVSIVESDVLKVSDIFDGVTHNANYVIGAAPHPGEDMTLNARTLYRIAKALDLGWKPVSAQEQITVRRDATVISYADIERKLKSKIEEKGVHGHYSFSLNNGKPSMVIPASFNPSIEITQFEYDTQKDIFTATLVSPSRSNPIKKMSVSGSIERLVTVPVLRSSLQNGDIIGKNDINLINVPQDKLQHDVVMDENKLIGMTPRRVVHAGKFVLNGMLQRPQIVGRGEPITIEFKSGSLTLTAKGRALQDGAKGDLIRVKNMNSNLTVDAIITASNQVKVQ